MIQSDSHSVSSGMSTTSTSIQQQQSVASTITPQNPFDNITKVSSTTQSSSSTTGMIGLAPSGSTTPVPPSHVAIRMQQQQQQQQAQSPMRPIGTGATCLPSSATPPPTIRTATTAITPMQMSSSTPSIPSPVSHPNPSPQEYHPQSNTNTYTYPLFDPSQQVQQQPTTWTQTTGTTNANMNVVHNNNDFIFDDDENTAPSSLGNTTDDQSSSQQQQYRNRQYGYGGGNNNNGNQRFDPDSFPTTIGNSSITSRIIESTKRLISSTSGNDLNSDPITSATTTTTTTPILTASNTNAESTTPCLISGYLQKFGRNMKWQTRWFETNGVYLSYYKSSKRSKLLATLDLQKVGAIEMDPEDKTEHSFRIQVLGRLYQLRANSRASCQDWVITLNRVKEARLQQGNVKLVGLPTSKAGLDLLNPSISTKSNTKTSVILNKQSTDNFLDGTPRVVVVSNRERTHGVDEEEQWDELIRIDDGQNFVHTTVGGATTLNETDIDPAGSGQVETIYASNSSTSNSKRLSSIGTVVAARWTKHHSALQRLGTKLSKWARSIKKYSCTDADAVMNSRPHQQNYGDVVHLDKYLHPPGHDDKLSKQRPKVVISSNASTATPISMLPMNTTGLSSTTSSSGATGGILPNPALVTTPAIIPSATNNINTVMDKPSPIADRCLSTASDYDMRMLS